MSKRPGVYQWINEINGNSYVGSSKDVISRKREWLRNFRAEKMNYKCILHDAVRRYGIKNFTFIVLEECEPTKQALEERENYHLELIRPEYNLLRQAYTCLGRKASEEERVRRRGKVCTEETRQKLRIAHVNTVPSEECRKKSLEARLGKKVAPCSPERKAKIGDANRGRVHTAETRAKNSAAKMGQVAWNKGIPWSAESRAKMNLCRKGRVPWNKGIPQTEEVKAKLSATNMGRAPWNKGKTASPEARAKMSAAKKGKPPHNKGKPANPAAIVKRQATMAARAKLALAA